MPIFPSLRRHILNYGRLLAGNLLLSLGLAIFILPYDLNVGGMTGIALVLERLLPWELLTVDRWVFLLSWLLFFFGSRWGEPLHCEPSFLPSSTPSRSPSSSRLQKAHILPHG